MEAFIHGHSALKKDARASRRSQTAAVVVVLAENGCTLLTPLIPRVFLSGVAGGRYVIQTINARGQSGGPR